MKYGIFGDVHGDWPRLIKVIRELEFLETHKNFCLGDIVNGYRSGEHWDTECIDMITEKNIFSVKGNHDGHIAESIPISSYHSTTIFLQYIRGLAEENYGFIDSLPLHITEKDFHITHYNPFFSDNACCSEMKPLSQKELIENMKQYILSPEYKDNNICFLGHEHRPKVCVMEKNSKDYFEIPIDKESTKQIVDIKPGFLYFIWPGQVADAYAPVDTESKKVEKGGFLYDSDFIVKIPRDYPINFAVYDYEKRVVELRKILRVRI